MRLGRLPRQSLAIPRVVRCLRSQQLRPFSSSIAVRNSGVRRVELPLFQAAWHPTIQSRIAITSGGRDFTYSDLLQDAAALAQRFTGTDNATADLKEARVAFCFPGTYEYAAVQWGVWHAGGVAVPLHHQHSPAELEYIVRDSQSSLVVADKAYSSVLAPIARDSGAHFLELSAPLMPRAPLTDGSSVAATAIAPPSLSDPQRRAQLIYTSGTTGKPKGVVHTHAGVSAQVQSLVQAWEWTEKDHILHVLPLHHTHGIINALTCALWSGARVSFVPKFDARDVWTRFMSHAERDPLTLFMAVPTIYSRLIEAYDAASATDKARMSKACNQFRLMVSGSAALPVPTLTRWAAISGHTLLERYGMTEIGMALSNPLHGTRRPGYVGRPLPFVEAKLASPPGGGDPNATVVSSSSSNSSSSSGAGGPRVRSGELLIRGPAVFTEYYNKEQATRESFTADGWFRTGDIAEVDAEGPGEGDYRITGRASVDILKSGGYKISALDVEAVLLEHPRIAECAVVGVADQTYGQVVSAIIALKPGGAALPDAQLRDWLKPKLSAYQVPRQYLFVDSIPRNAMGKINKKQLIKLFDKPTATK